MDAIVIERRYRGPQSSGNGGYTCGRVAAFLDAADAVEVTLRLPPPLETPLRVRRNGVLRVLDGDALVAEAQASKLDLELPAPVGYAEASRLAAAHPPDADHPFPGCFTCGPEGDGLRLNPVPLGDGRVVAPWRPESKAPELVWAALDCPGAFAVNPGFARGLTVLGRLTAHLEQTPDAGDECVVVGWPLGGEGRRLFAGTAVFRGDEPLAWAMAVWVTVGSEFRDPVPSGR